MKHFFLVFTISLLTPIMSIGQTKIMSFNIRYDNPQDNENSWEKRKQELVKLIEAYQPVILGIQEGLHHQVRYIDFSLPNYNYVGVGRDDGKTKGEYTAIFYNKNNFKVLSTQTYWLSDTPNKVSVGWDASMERIVTFAKFLDKKNSTHLYVFNCHFDHIGKMSRNKSAELILKLIEEKQLNNEKLIVMGDLNCEPDDVPIQTLTQILKDSKTASETNPEGLVGTFNGFDFNNKLDKRIDYILVKNLKVVSYSVIDKKRENRFFVSDHFPVLINLD